MRLVLTDRVLTQLANQKGGGGDIDFDIILETVQPVNELTIYAVSTASSGTDYSSKMMFDIHRNL